MTKEISRIIQVDNWLFEVKAIRALKVKQYGDPYQAIANINFFNHCASIDGVMSKDSNGLSDKDYQQLVAVCKTLGAEQVDFDCRASNINEHNPIKELA